MSLTIRRVRPHEHERTGAIVLAAYDHVGAMSPGYRRELADTGARCDDETTVFVAVDGTDDLLGTVTSVTGSSVHFEHPGVADGGFRALAVTPGRQGAGIGRALVDHTIADGRASGWRRLAITTMTWMHDAQRLYARLGFDRRPDLDVRYPTGIGLGYTLDLVAAADHAFPAPGPVPDEPPWYEDLGSDRPSC